MVQGVDPYNRYTPRITPPRTIPSNTLVSRYIGTVSIGVYTSVSDTGRYTGIPSIGIHTPQGILGYISIPVLYWGVSGGVQGIVGVLPGWYSYISPGTIHTIVLLTFNH